MRCRKGCATPSCMEPTVPICSGPDTGCTDQSPYANVTAVVTNAASSSLHNMSAMTTTVTYTNSTAAIGNPVSVVVVLHLCSTSEFPQLGEVADLLFAGKHLVLAMRVHAMIKPEPAGDLAPGRQGESGQTSVLLLSILGIFFARVRGFRRRPFKTCGFIARPPRPPPMQLASPGPWTCFT